MLRCLFSWDAPNVNISIFLKQTVYMVYRIEKWNSPSLKKWQFLAKCSCWFNAWTVLLLDSVWNRQEITRWFPAMITSYDYQLISSYAERTWSKRVVLPTLYLQSHLGLQMTGALKYKESELPSQPLQKPGAKTDLAELIQMVWFGYIWLVSN